MEAKSLPDALMLIKEQRDCSQGQLARDLGVGKSWVSDVIKGRVTSTGLARVIELLDRVGWEVSFRPKGEESDSVKRREFVAAAASVAFVPSSRVEPFKDAVYLREVAKTTARDRYERGGIASLPSALRQVQRISQVVESRD